MQQIYIVDYPQAKYSKLKKALNFLGVQVQIATKPSDIRSAAALILPNGFDDEKNLALGVHMDLFAAISRHIVEKKPLLALGLGTNFLLQGFCHAQIPECLEIFKAPVKRFDARMLDEYERPLKVPHIGFSYVVGLELHPFFSKLLDENELGIWFYFRNRLCAPAQINFAEVAVAHHGVAFAGAIWKEQVTALQFLPEYSGSKGLELLKIYFEKVLPAHFKGQTLREAADKEFGNDHS